ncbi:MAG: GNAT family N-acetyltransferase [Sulfuricellaceae bacterium]|nr:GNAT family N-acetyltransferase [Sulfuricellaceae bacterium]
MLLSNSGRSLSIRQSAPDDAALLLEAYRDESFVRLYRSNSLDQSIDDLRAALAERQDASPAESAYLEFIIEHRRHGPIGVAALGDYSALHRRAEFLVGIFSEEHRHGGYGIEATLLTLDLAFNEYGLNKVYAYAYEYNEYSHKNMIGLGFVHEATLKQHHYSLREKRHVSLFMDSIVLEDFRAHRKIRRLSLRMVGRDITQANQVFRIGEAQEIPLDAAAGLAAALGALHGGG